MSRPEGLSPSGGSADTITAPSVGSLAELASRYGLKRSAARPPLPDYIRALWRRRQFIYTFATSRNIAKYSQARLGQLWQILTPLLNAAVYYLIFGVLLGTRRGIENFAAFLVTGIFIFTFTQRSYLNGARSVADRMSLIRALHFPRACLPLATIIIELQQLAVSLAVLAIIVVLTGEPITVAWLLIIPALICQTMFNTGSAFIMARLGAQMRDISQLLPFFLRTWLYMSGVFYSISAQTEGAPSLVHSLLQANPGAVFIELARDALLASYSAPDFIWWYAVGWSLLFLVGGFYYFWRAEERYGRG